MEIEIQVSRRQVKKVVSVCLALLIAMSSLWVGLATVVFAANSVMPDDIAGSGDIRVGESVNVRINSNKITYLEFTPAYSGIYRFYSTANEDTYGYIYDENKRQLAYNDDGGNNANFSITYELQANTTYYFGSRYYNQSTSGSFKVNLICLEIYCPHKNTVEVAENRQCYTNGNAAGAMCLDCGQYASGGEKLEPSHTDNGDGICERCEKMMPVTSGDCGAIYDEWEWLSYPVSYYLYNDGTLEVFGSGIIAEGAFVYRDDIKNVIIYDGITAIGNAAFGRCDNLESVVMADTVREICVGENYKGWGSFEFNDNLKNIKLSESLKAIPSESFQYSGGLRSIEIPNSVVTVGNAAFEGCNNLEKVKLSSNLKALPTNIFYNCYSLKSVELPEKIEFIDEGAFAECNYLEGVTILNQECKISPKCGIRQEAIIYGYEWSTADDYAWENSMRFREYCPHENTENVPLLKASCYTDGHCEGVKCLDCGRWASGGEAIIASHFDENGDEICDRCEKSMPKWSIECGGNEEYVNEKIYYDDKARAYFYEDGTLEVFGEGVVKKGWPGGNKGGGGIEMGTFLDTKKLVIHEGITAIDTDCFKKFLYIEEVTLPLTMWLLRPGAFADCIRLSKIVVLNPTCSFASDGTSTSKNTVIYGYSDSSAEVHAKHWLRKFVPLDREHDHEFESKVTLKPTCTSTGVETFTCYCGESYTEVIAPNYHFDFDFDGNCDMCGVKLDIGGNGVTPDEGGTTDTTEEEKDIFASFFESIINFFKNLINLFNFFKN